MCALLILCLFKFWNLNPKLEYDFMLISYDNCVLFKLEVEYDNNSIISLQDYILV